MVSAETIAKVRMDLRLGKSLSKISLMRGISRQTVRKIRDSGATQFEYRRSAGKQSHPRLGKYHQDLEAMLQEDEKLPATKRRKWTRLHEDLQRLGYLGGYDAVRRFARRWKFETSKAHDDVISTEACTPMDFPPGEAFQFDWSSEEIWLSGEVQKIQVAHVTLCHSRMSYRRAYRLSKLEMVLDAHERAFAFFGGVCERGIYDNMKTVVTTIKVGKEREWNKEFLKLCSHYCFKPDACTPGAGNEKGRVERGIQSIQEDLFKTRPHVESLNDLNRMLEDACLHRARTRRHPQQQEQTIYEMFVAEQAKLFPLQPGFANFRNAQGHSSKTLLVPFERNYYSVHCRAAHAKVDIRVYADRLRIYHQGLLVGDHERRFDRGGKYFRIEHYIPILERKPGSVRNGMPYQDEHLPKALSRIRQYLKRRDDFEAQFVGILGSVLSHGMEAVITACELALEENTISKDAILNILSRLTEPTLSVCAVDDAAHLNLKEEPSFDCSIYDNLLGNHGNVQSGRSEKAIAGIEIERHAPVVRRGDGTGCATQAEPGCHHTRTANNRMPTTPIHGHQESTECRTPALCQNPDGFQLQGKSG